jgi:hypothetical protein
MTEAEPPRFCAACGKDIWGNYCSHCGAPTAGLGLMARPGQEGWRGVVEDLVARSAPLSVPSVMLSFAAAPIKTAISLARNPLYTGQWKFLLTAMGLFFSVNDILVPRILARLNHTAIPDNRWLSLAKEIVIVADILILAPLMYFICRLLGTIKPTPRSFLKLAVLSFGYWYLLILLVDLGLGVAGGLAGGFGGPALSQQLQAAFPAVENLAEIATTAWLVSSVIRPFCGMRWWGAILATVAYILVSRLVVFPVVYQAATAMDLTGWLKQLLG